MVTTFGNSEWATQSEGAVQSKSVTSCAGMTAHFVLLAQTKVGFLSGGRSRRMKELPQKEVLAQLEEAYARATVALTRAQKLWQFPSVDARGKLGGIACPPELLATIPIDKGPGLHLFHYDRDLLQRLSCVCTLVTNEWPDLNDHFGKSEHAYGYWIDLNMQVGYFQLWRFLQDFPAAADPKQRDVTPLRLMSWLSYQPSQRTHLLIKECMTEFAHIEPVQSDKIFQIGRFHLAGVGEAWTSWDNIRDAVIDEVTIRGKAQQPAVVVRLAALFGSCPSADGSCVLSCTGDRIAISR